MLSRAALWIYLGAFLSLVAAGLGFPMPEEVPIVVTGAMVGHASEDPFSPDPFSQVVAGFAWSSNEALPWIGPIVTSQVEVPPPVQPPVRLLWEIMLPVLILGVVISDGLLYGMGRFWGPRLLESVFVKRLIPPSRYQRIEENIHKYGVLVLLFARFLPTIRSPIFIIAGIMRLPFNRFLLADGLYAIPGVSLLFFLAFWFGDTFRNLVLAFESRVVDRAKPILILLALVAIAAYLVYHFFRHPVATGDPREEIPVIGPQVAAKITRPEDQPPILTNSEWMCPGDSAPMALNESGQRNDNSAPRFPDSPQNQRENEGVPWEAGDS